MATYGYARVSSASQSLTIQQEALRKYGCEIIRAETHTGTRVEGRTELETLLQFARAGDRIVVTRIDRLARSINDLCGLVRRMEAAGIVLVAIEQPIETSTPAGRCFLQMLGVFAEFETEIRRERQLLGIAKAKTQGAYKGRKPSIDVARVRELAASGMGGTAIAKELGVSRASVYRLLGTGQSNGMALT